MQSTTPLSRQLVTNVSAAGVGLVAGIIMFAGLTIAALPALAQTTTPATTTTSTSTSSSLASSTMPVISSVVGLSGSDGTTATVMWNTDLTTTSQVAYGTSSAYGISSAIQSNLVTNHSVTLNGLTPGTTYHVSVISSTTSGLTATSSDVTFMTVVPTPTPTPVATSTTTTGSDLTVMQNEIDQLRDEVSVLERQFAAMLSQIGTSSSVGSAIGTGSNILPQLPTLVPERLNVSPGASVDWNGRNFGHEEDVSVLLNGAHILSAHADGGGNFTTGSYSLPLTPGTYTYAFTGTRSGITETSVITVRSQ